MKIAIIPSAIAGFVVSLAVMAPVMAQTATGSFNVNATTTKFCTNPLAANISLGEYNGTATKTGSTNITFKCTFFTIASIKLKPGGSAVAASSGTLKTSPTNSTPVNYTLTPGSTFTGIGSGLGNTAFDILVAPVVNVAANQNPIPGNYSDTITVEISY